MVDHDLIIAKAGSIKKHLRRIAEKSKVDFDTFIKDIEKKEFIRQDLQDYLDVILWIFWRKARKSNRLRRA